MSYGTIPPLGSIAAVRPVFLIVMAVFLMVIAWRLARNTSGWTAWTIVSGALLLGFGYGLLIPLGDAGFIPRISPNGAGDQAAAMAWQAVKILTMNGGWLLFGIGLALHAKVFRSPAPHHKTALPPAGTHEFAP